MLYAVTTIRIGIEAKEFQNTETNQFMSTDELCDELRENGCDADQLVRLSRMKKGDSRVFENTIYTGIKKGTRFTYVHCIER